MTRPRHSLAIMMAVVIVAVGIALSVVVPARADTVNRPIQNQASGKCLEPSGRSTALGVAIVQAKCDGSPAQDWGFVPVGGNTYRLLNRLSGLCLEARGGALNDIPVVQATCRTFSNETWDTGRPVRGIVPLASRVSGSSSHCLDVPGGQAVDGLALRLYACSGTPAQKWSVAGVVGR